MFEKKVILSLFCVCLSQGLFAAESYKHYEAKVIEYNPVIENTQKVTLYKNVEYFITIITNSPSTDVLVFPEYGLTGINVFDHSNLNDSLVTIPEPSAAELCRADNVDQVINDIACITAQQEIYVVVNMLERGSDNKVYSTNVVFKSGTILAKYRKINLVGIETKHLTAGTEKVTFKTDFGVTFGVITSYDILHKFPGTDIFEQREVTDVIMPTAWKSEVPFYTCVGVQEGYAKKHGINLLASGYSDPGYSLGGMGVYTPSGNVIFVPHTPSTKTQTEPVEIIQQRKPEVACKQTIQPRGAGQLPSIESFKTQPMSDRDSYTYKPIFSMESKSNYEDEFCKGNMCCKFIIDFDSNSLTHINQAYMAVVSDKACGIIACENTDEISTCGSRGSELNNAYLRNITIEVKLAKPEMYSYMPVSSTVSLEPLRAYSYCETSSQMILSANQQSGVVYFGFIANGNSSINIHVSVVALVSALYFLIMMR